MDLNKLLQETQELRNEAEDTIHALQGILVRLDQSSRSLERACGIIEDRIELGDGAELHQSFAGNTH